MNFTNRIAVLDHGFVRLVSYVQPAERGFCVAGGDDYADDQHLLQRNWTGDLEVVRNARVSYDADWRTGNDEGSDAKLVRSMTQRAHTSPFEAMVFTFEVKAPIFVFRQWHRHRTWSYNEQSARYAEMQECFYVPKPEHIGVQHKSDKQMRDILPANHVRALEGAELISNMIRVQSEAAFSQYQMLLRDYKVPREVARSILPLNTYSRMFCSVDLHNLKHFLTLRQDEHAQYEIRVYADAIFNLVSQVVPVSMLEFDRKRSAEKELRELAVETHRYLQENGMVSYSDTILDRLQRCMSSLGVKF